MCEARRSAPVASEDEAACEYEPLKEEALVDGLSNSLKAQRNQILEEERHTPINNIKVLVVLFVVVLTINLLKGGGAFPSPLGITCGSNMFWAANAVMLGWIFVVSVFCRQYLVRRHEMKEECQYPYVEGDIKWDARATILYPIVCCLAGFFAGMFGVGG